GRRQLRRRSPHLERRHGRIGSLVSRGARLQARARDGGATGPGRTQRHEPGPCATEVRRESPRHPPTRAAARAMRSAIGVDVPELQQARSLWVQNRFDESLDLFQRAVRRYPQNLLALIDASRALGARFELQQAEALLDRAMALAGRNAQALHLAG